MSNAHIYLLVYNSGRYHLYLSRNKPSWPLSEEHIIYLTYSLNTVYTNQIQNQSFPVFKKRTPDDFKLKLKGIKK